MGPKKEHVKTSMYITAVIPKPQAMDRFIYYLILNFWIFLKIYRILSAASVYDSHLRGKMLASVTSYLTSVTFLKGLIRVVTHNT